MGLALLVCVAGRAQQKDLHNEIGVSYTSIRFEPHDQYFGAGIDYRYFLRSWVGFEAQASEFPEHQQAVDQVAANYVEQVNGCVLLGHRWGKVSLLGEGGYGVVFSNVFGGYSSSANGESLYPTRKFPDLVIGGIADVSLGRRWSLTYEVRDNLLSIGSYTELNLAPPNLPYPAEKLNIPEGRIGVAFHF